MCQLSRKHLLHRKHRNYDKQTGLICAESGNIWQNLSLTMNCKCSLAVRVSNMMPFWGTNPDILVSRAPSTGWPQSSTSPVTVPTNRIKVARSEYAIQI